MKDALAAVVGVLLVGPLFIRSWMRPEMRPPTTKDFFFVAAGEPLRLDVDRSVFRQRETVAVIYMNDDIERTIAVACFDRSGATVWKEEIVLAPEKVHVITHKYNAGAYAAVLFCKEMTMAKVEWVVKG